VVLINFILDLAGVLLWFHWRSLRHARHARTPGISLAATLKRTESSRASQGSPLLALAALLVFRSILYWHLGPAVEWTPSLPLGALSLPLRSDFWGRMMLFSLASFALTLGAAYLWLLLISVLAPKGSENDPCFRWAQHRLGWISRWPCLVKILLPLLAGTGLWYAAHPLIVSLGLMPRPASSSHLWQQALVMGLGTYLAWATCLVVLLGLYTINSYVYLGNYTIWTSINTAANAALRPFSWLPLRLGPVDLTAPLIIAASAWIIQVGQAGLLWLFQRVPM
jgi:hypothetical protein